MIDLVKEKIEELLEKMGIEYSEVIHNKEDDRDRFEVKSQESALLIGGKGENLKAFNYIIKKILEGDGTQDLRFIVDVENYYLQRVEKIKYTARVCAERAKFLKEDVEMEPMTSYERLVVHSLLSEDPELETESTGVGKSRRVVIKYSTQEE